MSLKHSVTAVAFLAALAPLHQKVAIAEQKPASAALLKQTALKNEIPDPVAKVNGVPIAASELKKAENAFKNSPAAAQIPPGKDGELQRFLLDQIVNGELLYQIAKTTPLKDQDKMLADAVGKLKDRFKSDEEYRKGLQEQGLTENSLKDVLLRNLVIENYIETMIVPKQTVTDTEIKEFYDKNPETFTLPEQVRASHILITVDPAASAADRKKAGELAESLLKQLKMGGDFEKLAQENSGCPSSKQGGDLGYFGKGQMVKPFEEAVFKLKPGELSGVVETQFGFHIIKLVEKRAPSKVPFNDVKVRIADSIKRGKVRQALESLLEDARKKASIEMFLK